MAHVWADRVRETATTTGTGNFTLAGAVTSCQAFSDVCSTSDTVYYCIAHQSADEWETGLGTYSATNTLTRTTVLASSNSGAAVNFASGTKDVFLADPAAFLRHRSSENILINGDGAVAQRPTLSSIADDAYHIDRWYALNQTSTQTASQVTLAADGVPNLIRLTQNNATAQRIGCAQIVLAKNSQVLRGQAVTLSGKVRMSASVTVRFAILEWTGTADSVTSDWVNDWTSGTYTAGNFFKSTTTTVTATGSLALTANTLTDFSLTGTVSSSANNVAVMIWSDATMAQNDTLDFRAKLEVGSAPTAWVPRPYIQEYGLCKYYHEHIAVSTAYVAVLAGRSTSIGQGVIYYAEKRTLPTVTFAEGTTYWDIVGTGAETISATYPQAEGIGLTSCSMRANLTTAALTGQGAYLMQGKSGAFITIDAEL